MTYRLFILVFSTVFAMTSVVMAQNSISRGQFGPFHISLNQREYGYQVVQDMTGTAPMPMIEKFVVKPGDCGVSNTWNDCQTDRERSELSEKDRSNKEGQSFWYGWYFFLPNSYISISPAKVALGQFHQDKGDPLWMFQLQDDGYFLEEQLSEEKRKYPLISKDQLKGRWHRVEVEVLWTRKQDGYFRVWLNGESKVNIQGPTKMKQDVYFKYGLYRSFLSRYKESSKGILLPTQEIYYSNVKRSKNRKGLGPNE